MIAVANSINELMATSCFSPSNEGEKTENSHKKEKAEQGARPLHRQLLYFAIKISKPLTKPIHYFFLHSCKMLKIFSIS